MTNATNKKLMRALAGVLSISTVAFSASPGVAGGYRLTRQRVVAPGLTYAAYRSYAPVNRVRVLTVDPAARTTLDLALARDRLPGWEKTSSMAQRHRAIAAINGDYGRPSGRPVFPFAADGHLAQTYLREPDLTEMYGRHFAIDRGETQTFVGHKRFVVSVADAQTGASVSIDSLNVFSNRPDAPVAERQPADELGLYTPVGAGDARPPAAACSVRLMPVAGSVPQAAADSGGVVQGTYYPARYVCRQEPLWRKGGIVVSALQRGTRTADVLAISQMSQARVRWSMGDPESPGSLRNVFDTVGGNPTLLEGGEIMWDSVGDGSAFTTRRAPRTAVAVDTGGNVLLVTVDGRDPSYSVGMSLEEFARFLRNRLAAVYALNLDGGGSTTMYLEGRVINRPSDPLGERPVSSAILVLAGSDPGEPPVSSSNETTASSGSPSETNGSGAWDAAVHDPASTGGLADYLRKDGAVLPPVLERAARTFSGSSASDGPGSAR